MFCKNKLVLLHLSLISGVGPASVLKVIKKLVQDFYDKHKNPELGKLDLNLVKLYFYKAGDFIKEFGLSQKIAQSLVDGLQDKSRLEKELELIQKYKIDLVAFTDSDYPENLKEIHLPPIVLYCKGEKLSSFNKTIAVVGARLANSYSQKFIETIIPDLVANDYVIISGGAAGVDSMAHKAAVNCGGKTIVVFGSGLMHTYPKENKDLFRSVANGFGTLVSPFSLQTPPERGNFPARNRIIAGLASGCLVVQAAQKSGALITAKFALDEGRQVFAVPGSIYDELSLGCHDLIKQGAKLVGCIDDVLEEFGENNLVVKLIQEQEEVYVDTKLDTKKDEVKPVKQTSVEQIKEDNIILRILDKAYCLDVISVKTGLSLEQLQEQLFDLQLDGKVKQNFTGMWERV